MKKVSIAIGLFLYSSASMAQSSSYIKWDVSPKVHTLKSKNNKESAVVLEDVRVAQYIPDKKLGMFVTIDNRRLIKVNDDKGIEMYNKIYIPIGSSEVTDIKARTISPSGKVVNLPSSKIFEVEEDGRKYKKFALEGVEKGSEIEYAYQLKKEIYFFGIETFQSSSTPTEKAQFVLSVPKHLLFTVKGYNGFEVAKDTVINEERIVVATVSDIVPFEDEKYSAETPYLKNVQYKLSYNLDKDNNVRLFTWNNLAKNVFSAYSEFTDKELKAIAGFVKDIPIKGSSEEDKIVSLEDYIKSNVKSDENAISEDAYKIEKIVKTGIAANDGFLKLFMGCMDKLGIKYQLVYPSKRDDYPLDEELENYRLVEDMIFYFPNTGKFLEPLNIGNRYPYVQAYWMGTKGLFLKNTTIGTFSTAVASFDSIPMIPYESSATNMEVSIKFNEAMDSLEMHSKQILLGFSANGYRPAFNYLPKDKVDEFSKEIVNSIAKTDNVRNIKIENKAMTDCVANKPLNIEADITSAEILEQAGNKILVKLGEVIGPQVQMYQEKERKLPVLIQYPHALDRDITFTIPKGYTVKNLNDLNINIADKEQTMGFVSSYTMSGSDVKIKVHEYYKVTEYPISQFIEFQKVINASADFNKIVLVLEKK